MTSGGSRDRLTRRGIADRRDPLKAWIWIHGKRKATAAWNNSNDRNQDVSVELPGGR